MKAYTFEFCTYSGSYRHSLVVVASSRMEAEHLLLWHPAVQDYLEEQSQNHNMRMAMEAFRVAVKEHDTAGVVFSHSERDPDAY